jgi:hypothetical protein
MKSEHAVEYQNRLFTDSPHASRCLVYATIIHATTLKSNRHINLLVCCFTTILLLVDIELLILGKLQYGSGSDFRNAIAM